MKLWKILACLIPITLGTSIALGVQANSPGYVDGARTVNFPRTEPCATCGHAAPVTITCDDLNWYIITPGTVPEVARKVCRPGSTYTWEIQR